MRRSLLILTLALTALAPSPALAVKVADVTHLAGARTNVLTGMGLVVGLKGTGDGGGYLPAIKPLAAMMGRFNDPVSVADLANANNVALVTVTATMGRDGVSNGDRLDVRVSAIGAATSLRGGVLHMTPLLGPTGQPYTPHDAGGNALRPIPYALANGTVDLDDASIPTNGIVKGGAQMEVELSPKTVDKLGRFTLEIEAAQASWTMASTIAKQINDYADANETVAVAFDPRRVIVQIPASERERPDVFISNVQRLTVPMLAAEARVVIDSRGNGTMVMTGDVEISPIVVNQGSLSISTLVPPVLPSAASPQRVLHQAVPLDTTGTGGARLQDLANAFDQLKVPIKDRIEIVKQMHTLGALHAKVTIDGVELQ